MAGGWKSLYQGNYGKLALGIQDILTRKDAFSGQTEAAPHALESTTLVSIRFTPAF
jgi:hypothetical protein